MARISLTLCDVKPCTRIADRDFQVNGKTIHVCGEGCFVKYWSREYQAWRQLPYDLHVSHATSSDPRPEPMLHLVNLNQ